MPYIDSTYQTIRRPQHPESYGQAQQRCGEVMHVLAEAHPGETILLVTHGLCLEYMVSLSRIKLLTHTTPPPPPPFLRVTGPLSLSFSAEHCRMDRVWSRSVHLKTEPTFKCPIPCMDITVTPAHGFLRQPSRVLADRCSHEVAV